MRELLGELLLQMGQAAPALREFEASLRENPNRYRGLYGAARAAEVAGDRPKGTGDFEKLMALAPEAGTPRPQIVHAKAVLRQRGDPGGRTGGEMPPAPCSPPSSPSGWRGA